MKTQIPLFWTLPVLIVHVGCGLFTGYRLVSDQYGFFVEFPGKPIEQSGKNYEGLPKSLWFLEDDSNQEFFSAEATTYNEPLDPAPNWIPNRENLSAVEIQTTQARRFMLRATATGREVLAIATTARQSLTGGTLASIYIVDGRNLISITARTANDRRRAAFLNSLTLLR